jgi:hypothetical protein
VQWRVKVMKHLVSVMLIALTLAACGDEESTGPGQTTPPAVVSVVVTPASATLVSLGETVQLTASAQDASGNTISGKTFTWSSSDETIATVSTSGLVTAVVNGSVTITATSSGVNGTAAVDVNQVAAQLTFTVEPPTLAEATVPLTLAVEVMILDALGNAVTDATDAVTLAIGTNPSGGILLGTTTGSAVAGIASFSGLSIDRAGTGYTLVATAPNLSSATSATFTVVSGGTWTLTGSMSVPRRAHTATLLNDGTVLVVGGEGGGGPLLYNPATQAFSSAGTSVFSHGSLPSVTKLLDGTVLIVGGENALTSAEIYDPATLTFSATTGGTNANRRAHSATLLNDGRVLLAGGQDPGTPGGVTHALAELYDPSTGLFSLTASLNDHRDLHSATLLSSGNVLIVGGIQTTSPGVGISLASAEIYSLGSLSFSFTGSLTTRRGRSGSSLLGNGKVLVVGGTTVGETTAAAELFDPATGTFSATGSMATRRGAGTATLLSDGRVLVAGGNFGPVPVVITGRAELYDPASGLFIQLAASMNEARQTHTATLLLDGRVLVVGGFGEVSRAILSSAELYSVRTP